MDKPKVTSNTLDNPALQQAFLNDLDEKLWSSADKLRQQLDAANYKHSILTALSTIRTKNIKKP